MSALLKVNEHPVERVIRAVVGITLIGLAVTDRIGAWGYIGAIPLLTGLVGVCPLYTLLGMSTCPAKHRA